MIALEGSKYKYIKKTKKNPQQCWYHATKGNWPGLSDNTFTFTAKEQINSLPLAQKICEVRFSFKMSEITSDLVLHTSWAGHAPLSPVLEKLYIFVASLELHFLLTSGSECLKETT